MRKDIFVASYVFKNLSMLPLMTGWAKCNFQFVNAPYSPFLRGLDIKPKNTWACVMRTIEQALHFVSNVKKARRLAVCHS